MVSTTFNPINDLVVMVVFIGGVIAYSRGRIPQQTIKNLQDLTDAQAKSLIAQAKAIEELKDLRVADVKSIGRLEGQISLYKELPLRELAKGIKEVSDSNKQILTTLQATAKINAEDRSALVHQN